MNPVLYNLSRNRAVISTMKQICCCTGEGHHCLKILNIFQKTLCVIKLGIKGTHKFE